MERLIHLLRSDRSLEAYKDAQDLEASYEQFGCTGVEIICCGEDTRQIIRPQTIRGLHIGFYSQWVDFWNGNEKALEKEFVTRDVWESYYKGSTREALITQFEAELAFAHELGVSYVVFHVSDVTTYETLSYQCNHTDEEVIEATIALLNQLLADKPYTFMILLENLWWPGLTMRSPERTKLLLDGIIYPHKGIMLDIGHLLHTNPSLRTEEEAMRYLHQVLDQHGALCSYIQGVHLHGELTGKYVEQLLANPPVLKEGFYDRFVQVYEHIHQIDPHRPMTMKGIDKLIKRICPKYLVYEIIASDRIQREAYLAVQAAALGHIENRKI